MSSYPNGHGLFCPVLLMNLALIPFQQKGLTTKYGTTLASVNNTYNQNKNRYIVKILFTDTNISLYWLYSDLY